MSELNEKIAAILRDIAAGLQLRGESRYRIAAYERGADVMTAFRGAADRIVAAQREEDLAHTEKNAEYGLVLDHLYRAVQHLQSHDLVNQLIDAQKMRVDKMREKLGEALSLAAPPVARPDQAETWIERSRAMLDCIVAGIQQIDQDDRAPLGDKHRAGSVDLF